MLITNFDKGEEPIYREAVKRFGKKELYVDRNAYVGFGKKDNSMSALRCNSSIELTEFWKIFDEIKNTKWCITTNDIDKSGILYLGWQNPAWDESGYFWTSKDVIESILKNNTAKHPFLFNSKKDAVKQLKSIHIPQKCRIMKWT